MREEKQLCKSPLWFLDSHLESGGKLPFCHQAASALASASISCSLVPSRLLLVCVAPQSLAALREDRHTIACVHKLHRVCV